MIKLSVLYPSGEGIHFDREYYFGTHIPLVRNRLGDSLAQLMVDEGLAGAAPGTTPAYEIMGYLLFESMEKFQSAFGVHGAELVGDIPNFTNSVPLVQVNEVKLS